MPEKLGVYICGGCEIGASLDLERLAKVATVEGKATDCQTHACLCSDKGVAMIRQDLAAGKVDTVVIAACSPRAKTHEFSFEAAPQSGAASPVVERVNLREHVVWTHKPHDEDTQMLAEDYLRMGIVKARKSAPLTPEDLALSRTLLVVGGGITGITAALEAAEAGYEAVLVEKAPQLGGGLAGVAQHFPTHAPYNRLAETSLKEKIERVTKHPGIKVYTSTTIVRTEGQPGAFDVTLKNCTQTYQHRVGAIVLATGAKPYDASKLAHLGYGISPNVVTNEQFEALLARSAGVPPATETADASPVAQEPAGRWRYGLARPSDGRPVDSVLFVQCAGSRDQEQLPYCSATCCMATLKQADLIHQQSPATKVFIIYRDIVTPGQYEDYYRQVQNQPATFLAKGEVASVKNGPKGKLLVYVNHSVLGEAVLLRADIVVLAVGMVPDAADNDAIRELREAQARAARNESATQRLEAEKTIAKLQAHDGTEILNLGYRQGPDLPLSTQGFPNSNFVCFPYETSRTGIYAAGAVRAPMDSGRAEEDALGAALKAIQCVEMSARGRAVHPRAGDLSLPIFSLQRCTQCKRCTVECPFGALDEDENGTPRFNPQRCRRCGICMGACPERIVAFKNYSVDMIASMIKSIEVPEEDEEKPRILLFMCENDAYPVLDAAAMRRVMYSAEVRVIPLRCLGSMNIVWIADALSRGIDGIMLLGCKHGPDYQCHFVKGSEIASRRMENVKETLQRLQLEPERIQVAQISMDEFPTLPAMIDRFAAQMRELGPNPYKGF